MKTTETLRPRFKAILTLLSVVGVTLGWLNPPAFALQNQADCLDQMQNALQAIDQKEDGIAHSLDPELGNIRPNNGTVLLKGDPSKVVFLLHGFIASPYEVTPLGLALQAQGYTVVMPLIAGFGRSTYVAATTVSKDWVQSTLEQLQAAELCGSKVQVIGFSLGALLETKVLLEHPEVSNQVASLTLLSPALKVKADSLMSVTASVFTVLNSTPRVTTLSAVARKLGNHDLDIPEKFPDFYNIELPMDNVKEFTRLAASIDYSAFAQFKGSIKLIYSESDRTIDGVTGLSLISPYRSDVDAYAIKSDQNVPHQLLLSGIGGVLELVTQETVKNFKP